MRHVKSHKTKISQLQFFFLGINEDMEVFQLLSLESQILNKLYMNQQAD